MLHVPTPLPLTLQHISRFLFKPEIFVSNVPVVIWPTPGNLDQGGKLIAGKPPGLFVANKMPPIPCTETGHRNLSLVWFSKPVV